MAYQVPAFSHSLCCFLKKQKRDWWGLVAEEDGVLESTSSLESWLGLLLPVWSYASLLTQFLMWTMVLPVTPTMLDLGWHPTCSHSPRNGSKKTNHLHFYSYAGIAFGVITSEITSHFVDVETEALRWEGLSQFHLAGIHSFWLLVQSSTSPREV